MTTLGRTARGAGIRRPASARSRVAAATLVGLLVAVAGSVTGAGAAGPLLGWVVAAAVFCGWTWLGIWPLDGAATAADAGREDPSRAVADIACLLAAVFSLLAVAVVLVQAGNAHGSTKLADMALAIVAVTASWFLVHTVFTLRYARHYYADGEIIDFNQEEPPRYSDFAYVAFTIGMTFQVSDTDLRSSDIRRLALRHMFVSYLMGAVFVAVTINLVAGLTK